MKRSVSLFALFLLVAAAGAAQEPAPAAKPADEGWISMFDGKSLQGWNVTPFSAPGKVTVRDGMIVIGSGILTGVNWAGDFPKVNYEVRMEAARLEGGDFFAGITFPYWDAFCTWINGGWGGGVVGLSSIDSYDASENETTLFREFQNGRWYRLWLVVNENRIRAWIDDDIMIDVNVAGRRIELRVGEIDLSKPFGIATYMTVAGIRKIEYRSLAAPTPAPAP